MRILLISKQTQTAREFHSKLLSYRALAWDLRHVSSTEEATLALLKEAYDIAILQDYADRFDEGSIKSLLKSAAATPIVVVQESSSSEKELNWFRQGIDDVIPMETLSTNYLMRRLRLAIARSERKQSEQRHAVERLVYQRSTSSSNHSANAVNNHEASHAANTQPDFVQGSISTSNPSTGDRFAEVTSTREDDMVAVQNERAFETIWITREHASESPLSIALLRDHGPSLLLDEATDHLEAFAKISIFNNVSDYKDALDECPNRFDVSIVEQDMIDREGAHEFDRDLIGFPAPPMLIISQDRSDESAVTHILQGFDDCIPAQVATAHNLLRHSQHAQERWAYRRPFIQELVDRSPNISERRIQLRTGVDRRISTRYLITHPLLAIPIKPDGSPDRDHIREAFSLDFSMDGIGLQISCHGDIPVRNWLIGVEHDPQDSRGTRYFYSHVTVRSVSYPQGGVRLGTQFNRSRYNMLDPDFLLPKFNPKNGRFQHPISQLAIDQWVELGVLQPKLLHRIRVCPECAGTATLTNGCRECGSQDIEFRERLKHLSCGYQGPTEDFQHPDGIYCPNCYKQPLQLATELEITRSEYLCSDCNYQGTEVAEVGSCFHCHSNFTGNLAEPKEIFGYEADRLDVLSIVSVLDR